MAFTTPLLLPLVKGLDQSKAPQMGPPDLSVALNVDFTVDGEVRGRPSRATASQFVLRDPTASVVTAPAYLAAQDFDDTGLTPSGLVRVRDVGGERAGLGTQGRFFEHVGSQWLDRGHFACIRADRVHLFDDNISSPTDSRGAVVPTFGHQRTTTVGSTPIWTLLTADGGYEKEQLGGSATHGYAGNGARCGSVHAIVSRGSASNLYIHLRSGTGAVTSALLATDAVATSDDGDAPIICCDHDETRFFVAYLVTGGTDVKILQVSTAGVVTGSATSVIPGVNGLWLSNTPVAGNRVVLACTDTSGLRLYQFNASTMALVTTSDQYATSAGVDGFEVVVGCQDSTKIWWCYRSADAGDGELVLGTNTIGSTTMTALRRFYGGTAGLNSSLTWAICHQPLLVDGRMYITLAAAVGGQTTATWVSLDLTNFYSSVAGTGPFNNPTLVAQGPAQTSYPHRQPAAAVTLLNDAGWGFATMDWTSFALTEAGLFTAPDTVGSLARMVWNKLTFSGVKAAHAGVGTYLSGSVPHFVAGGECTEVGFPFIAGVPGLDCADDGSVGGTERSFSVQACWRWTDAAGNVHRSGVSSIATQSLGGTFGQDLLAIVTNPWLCEKAQDVYIELYMTDANPTEDAAHFLQTSVPCDFTAAATSIQLAHADFVAGGAEPIYSDGNVLPNRPVRADGGVVSVGRRLWAASDHVVYASKYITFGEGIGFNDYGTHQVYVPTAAGRIVALEAIDDKVIVFCERGVYAIQDGGPDKTGVGADFMPPLRLSDLAIAGPRSSCSTDIGVVFCTPLDETDASRGGPWVLDRQLTFTERQYMGRAASSFFLGVNDWKPEVAYSSERQQVYIAVNDGTANNGGAVVLDLRVGKWAVWELTALTTAGALRGIGVSNGLLWAMNTTPSVYSGTPADGDEGSYPMVIKTSHLAADGTSPLGWGRVRGIQVLHASGDLPDTPDEAYTLDIDVVQDGTRESGSGPLTIDEPALDTAPTLWPSSRQSPEWRLPYQKCATIQVQLTAQPATARWTAIQLNVTPLRGPSPARNRS